MAFTLTSQISFIGTAADFGDALSLVVSDSIGVKAPQAGASKMVANANGGSKVSPDPTGNGNKYVYIKHTGKQDDGTTDTTNTLEIHIHDGSGTRDIGRLKSGEFLFIPILSANKVELVSNDTHKIQFEYAYFTASS